MNTFLFHLVCAALATSVLAWPPASNGGLSEISAIVGLGPNTQLSVAALADWDGDKYVDLLGVLPDGRTFCVLLWNRGNHSFNNQCSVSVSFAEPLVTVMQADMDRDGWVDAVVTHAFNNAHIVYGGNAHRSPSHNVLSTNIQHSVTGGVIYGRCAAVDLLGLDMQGNLVVFKNPINDVATGTCDIPPWNPVFKGEIVAYNVDSLINSVAVVDLNGDCRADLVYSRTKGDIRNVSIVLLSEDVVDGFAPSSTFQVPSTVGLPVFGDYNADGAVDVAFPACSDNMNCTAYDGVLVLINELHGSDPCPGTDCCTGHSFGFVSVSVSNVTARAKGYSFASLADGGCLHAALPMRQDSPIVVRAGDVNLDSFTDLVVMTTRGVAFMMATNAEPAFTCRLLTANNQYEPLGANHPGLTPFFFDIDNDGVMDVMTTGTTYNKSIGVRAYWNGLDNGGNYYLSALMLNGVDGAEAGFPAYGSAQLSAVSRFKWPDIDGSTKYAGHTQVSMSQHHALHFPSALFGLGRTFSYIESFSAGVQLPMPKHSRDWPVTLVPNSQIVVISHPIEEPSSWSIKLFVSPSKYVVLVLVAFLSSLVVVGIPIGVLKLNEIRADRAEQRALLQ